MRQFFGKESFSFWRKLINIWTFVFFASIVIDLLSGNIYEDILNAISTIYISVLAIYVSNKEFDRWYDKHEESHPGEFFVVVWSVIIIILFIFDFIFGIYYKLPSSVISSYIAVLTILVITRKSKELYQLKHR
jgi:small-conductance mechanosensitive channel